MDSQPFCCCRLEAQSTASFQEASAVRDAGLMWKRKAEAVILYSNVLCSEHQHKQNLTIYNTFVTLLRNINITAGRESQQLIWEMTESRNVVGTLCRCSGIRSLLWLS
ncbi:hypothetical protein HHUSO_G20342 [Huso huso]|uniref:Uncharacterized protein n=1 Tax=Huso huso TaxID=61971 RepID=A0ABR0Z413_HUSHU